MSTNLTTLVKWRKSLKDTKNQQLQKKREKTIYIYIIYIIKFVSPEETPGPVGFMGEFQQKFQEGKKKKKANLTQTPYHTLDEK